MPNPNLALAEIRDLLAQVRHLRDSVIETQQILLAEWDAFLHQKKFRASAANLAAYIGLRRHDLRELQVRLACIGLSSLGRSEAHVIATLDAVQCALELMSGSAIANCGLTDDTQSMQQQQQRLAQHTADLFKQDGRATVLMVTLPVEAADNYTLIHDMLSSGMACARINCAHDDAVQWLKMVYNIRRASKETGRHCQILFDLAGPKLRTGAMVPGPAILHIKIRRDEYGNTLQPTSLILDGSTNPGQAVTSDGTPARLSVSAKWLKRLKPGHRITFHDLRKRKREFIVTQRLSANEVSVTCKDGAYLAPGILLKHHGEFPTPKETEHTTPIGDFIVPPEHILLKQGETLLLTRTQKPGHAETRDKSGRVITPGHIPCSEPSVFDFLRPGQVVWIDDGRVACLIEHIDERGAWLHVTQARPNGDKIGPEKGLNFPDSALDLPVLSEKDLQDLDFAAQHADLIGLSFVQGGKDLDLLQAEMAKRKMGHLGVIAKIETKAAIKNLPEIIIRGAGHGAFGIMIARGDLAVEIGYERLAEMQEEMLWLCEAAHVPVIWATQVLESLVKQNLPSRAEITDAAMSERAECVMLNKGPFVVHGMTVIHDILSRMQGHQVKKTAQYRALHW